MSEKIMSNPSDSQHGVAANPTAEAWQMRVEDGRNKLAAGQEKMAELRATAKAAFGNMLGGAKRLGTEVGLVSLSLGYEAVAGTKRAASEFARRKGAEFLAKTKEDMIAATTAAKAREQARADKREARAQRREDRQEARAERQEAKLANRQEAQEAKSADRQAAQAAAEARQLTRESQLEAMQQQEVAQASANRQAEALKRRADEILAEARAELEVVEQKKAELKKQLVSLKVVAINRSNEANQLAEELARDPDNLDLKYRAKRAAAVSEIADSDVAEVSRNIGELENKSDRLLSKIQRAEAAADGASERIENRKLQAEQRKANRQALKREARGDGFRSAGARLGAGARVAMRRIGQSLRRRNPGRFGAAVAGFKEGWQSAGPSAEAARPTAG